jgi:diguanylate cyclase (GGDEF)-like protein
MAMSGGSLSSSRWSGRGRVVLIAVLIAVVGLAASAYAGLARGSAVRDVNERSFQSAAANLAAALRDRLDTDIQLTGTMRAIAALEPNAGQTRYEAWYAQLQRGESAELQGADAALIVPVAASKLAAFEQRLLADPAFRKKLGSGTYQVLPAGSRATYCLSQAIVGPAVGITSYALTLDYCAPEFPLIGRSPFPALIQTLASSGSFVVTPVPLSPGGTLVAIGAAVYRPGSPLATAAQRRAAVIAYIATTFDSDALIRSVIDQQRAVVLALYHRNVGGGRQLIGRAGTSHAAGFSSRRDLGDGWVALISGTAGSTGSPTAQGLVVFAVGALLTALLILLYMSLARSRQRAWGLVGEKTEELEYRALHDALTGLPNRALVLDRAEQVLARARRRDVPVTALFMDVDGFKQINDRFGHKTGDEVLRQIGARLQSVLRGSDTVGRLGGDEFVVVLDCDGPDAAEPQRVAERILGALRAPLELPDGAHPHVSVSASIGIATSLPDSAEDLLQEADIAMYQAKAAGKSGYVLFAKEMEVAASERASLEMDLADALETDQLFLDYQPLLDLETEQVVAVEALLRWQHPTRGVITPDGFIPIAESSGLIAPIGRWVLHNACGQAAAWRARGFAVGLAVNVSPRQLERADFPAEVRAALADSGLEPAALTLDISEATLARRPASAAQLLAELKAVGVGIAVDDFGAGYASLGHLHRFGVDAVKIDRSFIGGLTDDATADAVAHTLIKLGKTLGITTVAEGVEHDTQLRRLRAEGCDLAQGFLFARPLTPEALEHFLEQRSTIRPRAALQR